MVDVGGTCLLSCRGGIGLASGPGMACTTCELVGVMVLIYT